MRNIQPCFQRLNELCISILALKLDKKKDSSPAYVPWQKCIIQGAHKLSPHDLDHFRAFTVLKMIQAFVSNEIQAHVQSV